MTKPTSSHDVTMIGLGAMGSALARAFVAKGRRVAVWNRDLSKAHAIAGATVFPALPEAVDASPVTVVCLTGYATWFELMERLAPDALAGKTLIQLSSGAADEAVEGAVRQQRLGAVSLDGAIMVFPGEIGAAHASVLLSGDADAAKACEDLLHDIAGRIDHLGPRIGDANAWDTAVLIYVFGGLLSALQAAALLSSAGVPLDALAERLKGATGALPHMIETAAAGIQAKSYHGEDVSLHTLKALWGQMAGFLERTGGRTDFLATVRTLTSDAIEAGHGSGDFSALFEVLKPGRPLTS